jgi:hypothetical protein
MKKRFCTIVGGVFWILCRILLSVIFVLLSIFSYSDLARVGWIVMAVLSSITVLGAIYSHHWNFIIISEKGASHKGDEISWDKACITMYSMRCPFGNRAYYFAFGDRYYSADEIKEAHNKGFVLAITMKRAEEIFLHYKKHIEVTAKNGEAKILDLVLTHNDSIRQSETKLKLD